MKEKTIFLIGFAILLGVALFMAYYTNSILAGSIFFVIVVVGAAFYLFQFGSLSEFKLEALSAKASFVRQKVGEVEKDAEQIRLLKVQSEQAAAEIEWLHNVMEHLGHRIQEAEKTAESAKNPVMR